MKTMTFDMAGLLKQLGIGRVGPDRGNSGASRRMPEITVESLGPRHQKLIENAHIALHRSHVEYVLEITSQVLLLQPGCLPVRKLQRAAQLRQHNGKHGGFFGKALNRLSTAPLRFGAARRDPMKLLEAAEAVLEKQPSSIGALRLLADAAGGLGWHETVLFALGAVREIEPQNRASLLSSSSFSLSPSSTPRRTISQRWTTPKRK